MFRRYSQGGLVDIYVSNLSREVTEEELRIAFGKYGRVDGVTIIKNEATGAPSGRGIVAMPIPANARVAAAALNGREWKGQTVTVSQCPPPSAG